MQSIEEWLTSIGLAQYAALFAANDIDVDIVGDLTDPDLEKIGVASLGHRRKLLRAAASVAATPAEARTTAAQSGPPAALPPATGADPTDRPVTAERRHMTVMFCDLVGSTALAARLDPEDVREVVRAYQACCAQVIGHYEGFVAQYLGDGIMAYFGYPAAHEDDAERAVRAGLDLIAAVTKLEAKAKVQVRIGIATGLVVVGDLIGEHAAKERAVTGETPNLAARLQGLAAPGSIVVSSATRRLLGGMFELRDLGAQQVKGLDAPITPFAVEGLRSFESRFEARAGGLTGFIGREEECDHLLARKKLAWKGRGQVVLVSGEAGIGKSRLTAWLVEQVGAEPHTRMRYQCTPHHKDSSLYPTIAQLERAAGIEGSEATEQKVGKLEALLAMAQLPTAETVPLFAALLGVPTGELYPPLAMSPGQQRQRTLAAMLDQIEGLARQKPLLMIYEDAHWADATSLELLDSLVDRIALLPVLFVVTGRPEFSPPWTGRHNVTTLNLQKLDKRQTRAMVERVTGGTALPADVLEQIVAKTDGVPLFVEELTKTVLESGILAEESNRTAGASPAFAIPATLQDSLMARLDRSNPVKEIAQIGAAIGREFSYALLVAVAGMEESSVRTALAKLEEAELASRRGVPPDATYTFKHALVQDAAYESLLKSRRQTIHLRIANALSKKFPAIAETEPEIVAYHFAQGGGAEQSIDWWAKAGGLALKRSAFIEARSHFENGIALATHLPETPQIRLKQIRLLVSCGQALMSLCGYGAPETKAMFDKARQLAVGIENTEEKFSILYGLWVGNLIRVEHDSQLQIETVMLEEAKLLQPSAETSVAHRLACSHRWTEGNFREALIHADTSVVHLSAVRDAAATFRYGQDVRVTALCWKAFTLWPLGQIELAATLLAQSIDIGRQCNHTPSLAYALNSNMQARLYAGTMVDATKIEILASELISMAEAHALPFFLICGRMQKGWAMWRLGDREAGKELMEAAEAARIEYGMVNLILQSGMMLADMETDVDPRRALERLDHLVDEGIRTGQRWCDSPLHQLRAKAMLLCGPSQATNAEQAYMISINIARSQMAKTYELRASLGLGRLYCDTGREREAKSLLEAALVGLTETPELPEIGEAHRLLASLENTAP